MQDSPDRPDPRALLQAFIVSGRDEKAFLAVVAILQNHPPVAECAMETTPLQSASAMRSERRQQRKEGALAEEQGLSGQ